MKTFKKLLVELNACKDAIEWAGDKSWQEIYNTCHRGDWLLWLFKRTNPDDLQLLILAKGHCANTVRHLMKDERSIKAVDAAIAYGEGKISREELDAAANAAAYVAYAASAAYADAADAAAANAAFAAAYAYSAASAAYDVAAAAAYAAASAAYDVAAAAAYAAAYVDAAAANAAYAAYDTAKKENQQLTADICRKYLPIEVWNIK